MATFSTGNKAPTKKLTKIGSAWKAKSKEGRSYLQGALDDGRRFIMFTNEKKSKDNSPDFLIYLSEKRDTAAAAPAPAPTPKRKEFDDFE